MSAIYEYYHCCHVVISKIETFNFILKDNMSGEGFILLDKVDSNTVFVDCKFYFVINGSSFFCI